MRSDKVMVRVNQQEKSLLNQAATSNGLPVAAWMRQESLRLARKTSGEGMKPVSQRKSSLGLLSLFCGPGGLDEGFHQAGFSTFVAIDNDKECINTFALNHPSTHTSVEDITQLTIQKLDKIAGSTISPLGVLGGPPCQSFSVSNVHQFNEDPRHRLPEAYARLLAKLNERNPISFFVFENVPGLLGKKHLHRYERFKRLFARAGFKLCEALLDAQDYGVPQERSRIIIVGINEKKHPGKVWIPPKPEKTVITVGDVLHGLPHPIFNAPGLDPQSFPVHPNHWCLVPRSAKFTNGKLEPGTMFGRSFRTLQWDKPSWTVAYGHREVHVHPNGKRRLSMYEALLLQTFPSKYRLTGNLSAQIRLVSEAVPPRLAYHIAKSIRETLSL
jgi:DNA (cytosine-5)-methyltransferase 1